MPVVASAGVQTTPTTAPWSARTLLETSSLLMSFAPTTTPRNRRTANTERRSRGAPLTIGIGAWALKATSGRTDVALFRPDDQDPHVSRAENTSRMIPGPQREQTQMVGSTLRTLTGAMGTSRQRVARLATRRVARREASAGTVEARSLL